MWSKTDPQRGRGSLENDRQHTPFHPDTLPFGRARSGAERNAMSLLSGLFELSTRYIASIAFAAALIASAILPTFSDFTSPRDIRARIALCRL